MNNTEQIREFAKRYPRHIRWSDEDKLFVGSLPDLCGDCTHGDTVEKVAKNLEECAELCVEDYADDFSKAPPVRSITIVPSTYRETGNPNAITAMRKKFGWSQRTFAKAIGVSMSTVEKWENGARTPSGSSAKLLDILTEHPELISL